MTLKAPGRLCALVAIKSRAHCKSRLSGVLSAADRLSLVRSLLSHVLAAAQTAHSVAGVIVVSPERDTVPADTRVLADSGASLNTALSDAYAQLRSEGCTELLILPADLPRVSAAEIDAFVQAGREAGIAIAADAAHLGTNALYLPARVNFPFRFGQDSLQLHLQEAARLRLAARVVDLPGLAYDVDTPQDLAQLGALSSITPREILPWQTQLLA